MFPRGTNLLLVTLDVVSLYPSLNRDAVVDAVMRAVSIASSNRRTQVGHVGCASARFVVNCARRVSRLGAIVLSRGWCITSAWTTAVNVNATLYLLHADNVLVTITANRPRMSRNRQTCPTPS